MAYGDRHTGLWQQEGFKIQVWHDMIRGGFRSYEIVAMRPNMSEHTLCFSIVNILLEAVDSPQPSGILDNLSPCLTSLKVG